MNSITKSAQQIDQDDKYAEVAFVRDALLALEDLLTDPLNPSLTIDRQGLWFILKCLAEKLPE